MHVGEFIRERRKKQKRTLKQVSKDIGISYSFLSQIEKGDRGVSADLIKKLSETLHVDYYKLMNLAGYISDEEYKKYEDLQYRLIDLDHEKQVAKNQEKETIKKMNNKNYGELEPYAMEQNENTPPDVPNLFLAVEEKINNDKEITPYFDLYRLLHSNTDTLYKIQPLTREDKNNIMKFIESFIIDEGGD